MEELNEERKAIRHFVWSRNDKPFTYLPLETIREMLAWTEVDHVNDDSYRECKAYLRCMKKIGLEVNTHFKHENLFTSCGSNTI